LWECVEDMVRGEAGLAVGGGYSHLWDDSLCSNQTVTRAYGSSVPRVRSPISPPLSNKGSTVMHCKPFVVSELPPGICTQLAACRNFFASKRLFRDNPLTAVPHVLKPFISASNSSKASFKSGNLSKPPSKTYFQHGVSGSRPTMCSKSGFSISRRNLFKSSIQDGIIVPFDSYLSMTSSKLALKTLS
jgi:hypothetical protein